MRLHRRLASTFGTISLKSAVRFGDVVEFTQGGALSQGAADIKNMTFFIGLAAAAALMHVNSQVAVTGFRSIYAADGRVLTVPQDPPGGL